MFKTITLALCLGLFAADAASQNYGSYYQRTPVLVTLPARPVKAHYTDHYSYRAAMQRYHDQTRATLRAERNEYRRLYHQRRSPAIFHQERGGYSPVYHRQVDRTGR